MPLKPPYRFSTLSSIATFYPIEPLVCKRGAPAGFPKFWANWGPQLTDDILESVEKLPSPVLDNAVVGIEVEVEKLGSKHPAVPAWAHTHDNSLRDNGAEYLLTPSSPAAAYYGLATLLKGFQLIKPQPVFSWRTSIHVHLNMREERIDQIMGFLVLYLLFEDSIFDFVGDERRQSNFCVPLQDTDLAYDISRFLNGNQKLPQLLTNWSKYTALNYRPLLINDHAGNSDSPFAQFAGGKGTVEFRHLEGTYNLRRIVQWLNIILSLQKASRKYSLDYLEERISSITQRAEYLEFMEEIFDSLLPAPENFAKIRYNGIAYAKECFCPMPQVAALITKQKKSKTARTGLQQMINLRYRGTDKASDSSKAKKKVVEFNADQWATFDWGVTPSQAPPEATPFPAFEVHQFPSDDVDPDQS